MTSMREKSALWNPIGRLRDNPIIAKELKDRMRGSQGFAILTAYLLLISLIIICVYFYSTNGNNISRTYPNALLKLGKLIFNTVIILELLMIVFIGPALTSGAISSERERRTFDLLRVSLLSSCAIVLGKLGTAVIYLLLLIIAALPLQSLAFIMAGVSIGEMIISIVILSSSVFLFCTLGLYFSCIARRTTVATVLSYATLILVFAPYSLVLFSPWILYVIFSVIMTVIMILLIIFYLNRYER